MQQYQMPLPNMQSFTNAVTLAKSFGGKLDTAAEAFQKVPEGHPFASMFELMFTILIPEDAVAGFDKFLKLIGADNELIKVAQVNKAA